MGDAREALGIHTWGACESFFEVALAVLETTQFSFCALWDDKNNKGGAATVSDYFGGTFKDIKNRIDQIAYRVKGTGGGLKPSFSIVGLASTAPSIYDLGGVSNTYYGLVPVSAGFGIAGQVSLGSSRSGVSVYSVGIGVGLGTGAGGLGGGFTWVDSWGGWSQTAQDFADWLGLR